MTPQIIGRFAERDVVLQIFTTLDDVGIDRHPETALLLWILDPGWHADRLADAVTRLLEAPVAFLTVSGPRIEEMFMTMIDAMNGLPHEPSTTMNVIAGLNVADSLKEFLGAASERGMDGAEVVIALVGDQDVTDTVGSILIESMEELGS